MDATTSPIEGLARKPGSVPDAALWSRLSEAVSQTESVSGTKELLRHSLLLSASRKNHTRGLKLQVLTAISD